MKVIVLHSSFLRPPSCSWQHCSSNDQVLCRPPHLEMGSKCSLVINPIFQVPLYLLSNARRLPETQRCHLRRAQEWTSSDTKATNLAAFGAKSHQEHRAQSTGHELPRDAAQGDAVFWCAFLHICSQGIYQPRVCRKITLQKGKRNKNRKRRHIPHLKGRSEHRDIFLTQRYMLAHIPLTKINMLASVLIFASSFSSHLNHYDCSLFIAHYLLLLPSMCLPFQALHQLPLLQPLSAAFLFLPGSYLDSANHSSLDLYLTLHHRTLGFIHLFSFIFKL